MVSYCDHWMSGLCLRRHASSTNASMDISYITAGWIWTKLSRNDPYKFLKGYPLEAKTAPKNRN